jgi:hypothetical protein
LASALLHVTNGESAGATLRRTTLGGEVLAWQDALHEGPVPRVERSELVRLRAGFLSDCGWGDRSALLASLERRDRLYTGRLREGAQVVLWFEHDLYDQLQLLDTLALAREVGRTPELIVVGSFPGRRRFSGLGELSADELETLWPGRQTATAELLAEAAAAWGAFRSPDPTALAECAAHAEELPFLGAALQRLLEELPAADNGLSGTERRALEAITAGAPTPAAAFASAQALEDAPFLGDTWFHRALATLGEGDARLVETAGGVLRLTEAGERVRRGELDRVELLGVDRWLGGTHLEGTAVWRWDHGARTVVAPLGDRQRERPSASSAR